MPICPLVVVGVFTCGFIMGVHRCLCWARYNNILYKTTFIQRISMPASELEFAQGGAFLSLTALEAAEMGHFFNLI